MAKSLIFGLLLVGICCSVNSSTREIKAIANLANVILRSTNYMNNESAKCFQDYKIQLNKLTDELEISLNKCLNLTTQAEEQLKEQVQGDITTIQNATEAMCSNFKKCSSAINSLYDTFECYNDVAGQTVQSAYEVQNLSNDKMQYVAITEKNNAYKQSTCNDECWAAYIAEMAKANLVYDECEKNKQPRTTTVQPETTTIPKTTKVPKTTNEPKDSTTNIPETP